MKPSPAYKIRIAFLSLAFAATAVAQTSPSVTQQGGATRAPAGVTTTAPIRLNPFEVTTDTDGSFVSSNVGVGSRLSIDLADLPAAYSVMNRELIEALGITDMVEAASWVTGGTFVDNSFETKVGGQGSVSSRGNVRAPAESNVLLGAGSGNQRNFYQSSQSSTDSFSVETFDFGRGPNSSLFGTSSTGAINGGSAGFAGVASAQTKRARFDGIRGTLTTDFGYWGYRRYTLDLNEPITDKIGARLNLVKLHETKYMKRDFKFTEGMHLTTTFRLSPTTELRVEGLVDVTTQQGQGAANIQDNFSGWDGITMFRGPVLSQFLTTNATLGLTSASNASYGTIQIVGSPGLAFNGEPSGVTRIANTSYYFDANTDTLMNWRNFARARGANSTSRVPLWSDSGNNVAANGARYFVQGTGSTNVATGAVTAGFGLRGNNSNWLNLTNLPSDMYDRVVENSKFKLPSRRDNWAMWAPESKQWTRDLQFSFEQKISNNLFFSLGGDMNHVHGLNIKQDNFNNVGGGDGVRKPQLDLNMVLPNGLPNPNFLDTYMVVSIRNEEQWTNDDAIRLNLGYSNLDLGRFGNYTVNFNAGASARKFTGRATMPVIPDPLVDIRRWSVVSNIARQSYFSDEGRGWADIKQVMAFTDVTWDTAQNSPTIMPTRSITPIEVIGGVQADTATGDNAQGGLTISRVLTQYGLIQGTGKWLNDRITALASLRRDRTRSSRLSGILPGDRPGVNGWVDGTYGTATGPVWDGFSVPFKPYWTGAAVDFYNLTYQPRDNTGAAVGKRRIATNRPRINDPVTGLSIRNPLYSGATPNGFTPTQATGPNQLFQDDFSAPIANRIGTTYSFGMTFRPTSWLSPQVNWSNSTIPPSLAAVDLMGEVRKVQIARGIDFGAQFRFLGGKLTARYNYFVNTRSNDSANTGTLTQINNLISTRRYDDTVTNSLNSLGFLPLPGTDYVDARQFGYEVEIAGNITRGFRLSANGTVNSSGQDNATRFPLTKPYVLDPVNQAMFKSLLEDAGGSLDTSLRPVSNFDQQPIEYAPGFAVATPTGGRVIGVGQGLDQTAAVNAYNNIWANYDALVNSTNSTRGRRTPSANLIADYTIQTGMAKGLRIGFGFQYQGFRNVGNRGNDTILDPNAAVPTAIDDPTVNGNDQLWVKGFSNSTANLAYTFRFKGGDSLGVTLRFNNLFNRGLEDGYTLRQPDGDLTKPNRVLINGSVSRQTDPFNVRLALRYDFSGATSSR